MSDIGEGLLYVLLVIAAILGIIALVVWLI